MSTAIFISGVIIATAIGINIDGAENVMGTLFIAFALYDLLTLVARFSK